MNKHAMFYEEVEELGRKYGMKKYYIVIFPNKGTSLRHKIDAWLSVTKYIFKKV